MPRSRDRRAGASSHRFDNKTRQVCALAERALTLALGEHSDPLLQSLHVRRVLPAPSVARLLVVVEPAVEMAGERIPALLAALEANKGYFRSELASELNRKKTPELTFTIGVPEVPLDDDAPAGDRMFSDTVLPGNATLPGVASPDVATLHNSGGYSAGSYSAGSYSAGSPSLPHPSKRERPRNEKRQLRRQQRVAERRNAPAPVAVPLCDVEEPTGGVPIKMWTRGVPVEPAALEQLSQVARLPIVSPWVAVMPDVHVGIGATVGSVIPTRGAIIPAAVGVDLGCGMMAVRTTLTASQLPDSLHTLRSAIERAVPHGRGRHGGKGDIGSWNDIPNPVAQRWKELEPEYNRLAERHPAIRKANHAVHLGTLGTGNHFIEVCLDENQRVWVMLHSGSRGVGNRIGTYFIELAQRDMERHIKQLPHKDLAYFSEGSDHFFDYVRAVDWAQEYARTNRELMMESVLSQLRAHLPAFTVDEHAVNCHHNYVNREQHAGHEVYVTRKGAVSARAGELGIIPGSMGARSFIVRGKGNPESLCSCSHGAGRRMSRTRARAAFTLEEHARATQGVECRKDRDVIDETPMAYKDIDSVMHAQRDLVDVVHTLKQVVCVKG
jgi:tRNA-splicing ligase RtcB